MKISATPVTPALAGCFSAATWPLLWPLFKATDSSSSIWLMLGTLAFIALPAHAFVAGSKRPQAIYFHPHVKKKIGIFPILLRQILGLPYCWQLCSVKAGPQAVADQLLRYCGTSQKTL